ncbi:MAG: hypothetical protein J0I25_01020 [Sphingomonadales bacterium]|nr:hypothetical protein [Sphingomonadales bacterium]
MHGHRESIRDIPRRRWPYRLAIGGLVVAAVLVGIFYRATYFDRDPYVRVAATAPGRGVSALYLSGDMGLNFGIGATTADALAAAGIPVTGFNTPVAFRTRRTAAETNMIIAAAVRRALAAAPADRLVVIGRSFGADVLAASLPALPADLRRRIAAIVLVVPGRDVFFRTDPSNITYLGTPDTNARRAIRAITWAPLTCIHGADETESACDGATQSNATNIAMPGGHFLKFDTDAIVRNIMLAIDRATRRAA